MAAKNPTGEPDSAPFKVHLMTRAGRVMRARSEPVRVFSTKDEAVDLRSPAWRALRGVPQAQKKFARPVAKSSARCG
jgi:hypothetical protein